MGIKSKLIIEGFRGAVEGGGFYNNIIRLYSHMIGYGKSKSSIGIVCIAA